MTTDKKTIPIFGAVDEDDNYTNVLAATKGNKYTCPICIKPVLVADGPIRAKYLRHKYKRDNGCTVYDAPTIYHSNTIQQRINREAVNRKLSILPLHVKQYCKNKEGCCLGNSHRLLAIGETRLISDVVLTEFTTDGFLIYSSELFAGSGSICFDTAENIAELELLNECLHCVENRLLFRETVGDLECITECAIISPGGAIDQFKVWDKFGKKFCLGFEKVHFDLIDGHYRAETLPWIYKLKPKGNLKIDQNIDRRHYDETETVEDRITSYTYPPILLENCSIILMKDCNYFNDHWVRWIINNQPVRDAIKIFKKIKYAPVAGLMPGLMPALKPGLTPVLMPAPVPKPAPKIVASNWDFVAVNLPYKFKDDAKKIFNADGIYNLTFNPTTKWSATCGNLRHFDVIQVRPLSKSEFDILQDVLVEKFNPRGYTTVRFKLLMNLPTKKIYSHFKNKFTLQVTDNKYYNNDYIYDLLVRA